MKVCLWACPSYVGTVSNENTFYRCMFLFDGASVVGKDRQL